MKLIVIIPALNEEKTIGTVVQQVPHSLSGVQEVEVIVVDDGSTDDTAPLARQAGARVLSLGMNRGNGAAVMAGVDAALRAGADIIVTIDADGQFNPADIAHIIQPIVAGEADFVTCTRFARPDTIPHMSKVKIWGNKWVTRFTNLIGGIRLTDSSCGFRAYTRDTALRMNCFSTFDYAQEALIAFALHGVRMTEMSLPVRGTREFGSSRIASNLVRFAVKCLSTLLRTARDFQPLAFFGSIGAAFFGIGFLLGAFVMAHWWRTGQTAPYTSFFFGSAVGLIIGFLLFVLALIADSQGRQRRILEELLFLNKRAYYNSFAGETDVPPLSYIEAEQELRGTQGN
jgi:glycosyltransferase involved in cell wall biosynthesis